MLACLNALSRVVDAHLLLTLRAELPHSGARLAAVVSSPAIPVEELCHPATKEFLWCLLPENSYRPGHHREPHHPRTSTTTHKKICPQGT